MINENISYNINIFLIFSLAMILLNYFYGIIFYEAIIDFNYIKNL